MELSVHSRLAITDPEVWKIVDGKLYLNCSQAAYEKWSRDIPGHIPKADAVALRTVVPSARLARNPLVLSIAVGVALSASGARLLLPVERPLHMLGTTTATVAFFMLGAALYGRLREPRRCCRSRAAATRAAAAGGARGRAIRGPRRPGTDDLWLLLLT